MKFVVAQDALMSGLKRIQGVSSKKSTLEILSNFMLEANEAGLVLKATDLELSYQGEIEAQVQEQGVLTIPAHRMHDIVRNAPPGEDVKFSTNDQGWANISVGRSRFKMACLPAHEYPSLPDSSEANFMKVKCTDLLRMVRHTVFVTSSNTARYALSGVLCTYDLGTMTMVATDGHRLGLIKQETSWPYSEKAAIIPRKALEEFMRFIADGGDEEIDVAIMDSHIVFKRPGEVLISRLIEGDYPDYKAVIPSETENTLEIPKAEFLQSIKRVALLTSGKLAPIALEFCPEGLRLKSNTPEIGEADDIVPFDYQGKPMEIGVNSRYVQEILSYISTDNVCVEFTSPVLPVFFRQPDDPNAFHIVMPMRVQDRG